MNLSVIIPTLNEERCIGPTLRSVYRAASAIDSQTRPVLREIIIVDGDSQDQTVAEAERIGAEFSDTARLTVMTAPRGRARQMNAGAINAIGDVLLFLHADTLLGNDALRAMREALLNGADAGTFQLRFSPSTPLLQLYAACTRLPWSRLFFGDRGLFVRRRAFEAVGGYPDWPIFEDLEIVDRLNREGTVQLLPVAVTTSSRRFQAHGTIRQQLLNGWLWFRYLTGTPPSQLTSLYRYDTDPKRQT